MIRSFICWVASGLSLGKQRVLFVVVSKHTMAVFSPGAQRKQMNGWQGLSDPDFSTFFPGARLHL